MDNQQSIESEESYSPPESNTPAPAKALPPSLPTHENLALLEVRKSTIGGNPIGGKAHLLHSLSYLIEMVLVKSMHIYAVYLSRINPQIYKSLYVFAICS